MRGENSFGLTLMYESRREKDDRLHYQRVALDRKEKNLTKLQQTNIFLMT